MKTTQAQLAHRSEIHAEAIAASKRPAHWPAPGGPTPDEEFAAADAERAKLMESQRNYKRRGRPPLPLDQRTRKRNYSIRLTPEHIAELQKRGTKALEAWLHDPYAEPL